MILEYIETLCIKKTNLFSVFKMAATKDVGCKLFMWIQKSYYALFQLKALQNCEFKIRHTAWQNISLSNKLE